MMSLWDTTSSKVTGLYFSTLRIVSLMDIHAMNHTHHGRLSLSDGRSCSTALLLPLEMADGKSTSMSSSLSMIDAW